MYPGPCLFSHWHFPLEVVFPPCTFAQSWRRIIWLFRGTFLIRGTIFYSLLSSLQPNENQTNIPIHQLNKSLLYSAPVDPTEWVGLRKSSPLLIYLRVKSAPCSVRASAWFMSRTLSPTPLVSHLIVTSHSPMTFRIPFETMTKYQNHYCIV